MPCWPKGCENVKREGLAWGCLLRVECEGKGPGDVS